MLIGDYYFDHQPQRRAIADATFPPIAAAAHAPFIAGAAPSLMQMESWAELANPRDLSRMFQTPEYAAWRALRGAEDARYLGLCMPRMLARLPFGLATDPVDDFAFEEDVEGPDAAGLCRGPTPPSRWPPTSRAPSRSTAGVRASTASRTAGSSRDLPVLRFATADGAVDTRCCTEIALNERREAELARLGLIALVHRKNTDVAAFISAHSLQKPAEYDDPAATANALISARLPYLFGCCRFAHYLKCMVRDKVGGNMSRVAVAVLADRLAARLRR